MTICLSLSHYVSPKNPHIAKAIAEHLKSQAIEREETCFYERQCPNFFRLDLNSSTGLRYHTSARRCLASLFDKHSERLCSRRTTDKNVRMPLNGRHSCVSCQE